MTVMALTNMPAATAVPVFQELLVSCDSTAIVSSGNEEGRTGPEPAGQHGLATKGNAGRVSLGGAAASKHVQGTSWNRHSTNASPVAGPVSEHAAL